MCCWNPGPILGLAYLLVRASMTVLAFTQALQAARGGNLLAMALLRCCRASIPHRAVRPTNDARVCGFRHGFIRGGSFFKKQRTQSLAKRVMSPRLEAELIPNNGKSR